MQYLYLLLALTIPALLGGLWVSALVPAGGRARVQLVWGNGLLLGLLLIPLIMRLLDAFAIPLTFRTAAAMSCVLMVMAISVRYLRLPFLTAGVPPRSLPVAAPDRNGTLFLFFSLLIVLRVATVGLELIWQPLYPWDATMHWATKARVWFEFARIAPFVDNSQWLELGGDGVFTDHHPGYPATIPLLQVWINSAIGRWDSSLMNLPWLLCLVALGLAFYGQARAAGAAPTIAIVFTYMLLSLPLLNTHVSLAGYADLFLGVCYCAALMAFHNWSVSGQFWQAVLALVFACCCPLLKNEGLYWLLTFLPALLVARLPLRTATISISALLLVLICVLIFIPVDFELAGHSISDLKMRYRADASPAIATSIWVYDSWHLFGYLIVGLLILAIFLPTPDLSAYRGIFTALAAALILFFILFMFTKHGKGAIRFTAVSRISLHLVPGLMFLAMLLYNAIFTRRAMGQADENPG